MNYYQKRKSAAHELHRVDKLGGSKMKILHVIGAVAFGCAVGLAIGDMTPLLSCLALGLAGGAMMISTMQYTGWYQ